MKSLTDDMLNPNDPRTNGWKLIENCLNVIVFQDGDYVISILAQESERISVAKFQLRSNELENSDSLSVGMISFLTILAISGVNLCINTHMFSLNLNIYLLN